MSSILKFREIVITWKGKDYFIVPDFGLIERIEEQGVSIGKLAYQTLNSDIAFTKASRAISVLLSAAGGNIGHEEIYAEIFRIGKEDGDRFVKEIATAILYSCFPIEPTEDDKKKEETKNQ